MTLQLKKFDMKSISFKPDENKGPVVVLIGRRDTGKSFLVRDLLFYHQDIPIGTVISGTDVYCMYFCSAMCFLPGNSMPNQVYIAPNQAHEKSYTCITQTGAK